LKTKNGIILIRNRRHIMLDVEKKIEEVNATMAIENMPLTEDIKEELRLAYNGEVTFEELIGNAVAMYSRKKNIDE